MNRRPATNGRAIHAETFFERGLRQLVDWIGNVMPESRQVREAQIQKLDIVLLHELQDSLRIGGFLSHELLLCAGHTRARNRQLGHTLFL